MEETVTIVPIKFEKVLQAKTYTSIIFGNEIKRFAIYTSPEQGKVLQQLLSSKPSQRPQTHDLIAKIFKGLSIKIKQIVLYGVDQNIFEARLFIEQEGNDLTRILEIDARPSDCMALALTQKVPLYCTQEVLEAAVAFIE